MVKLTLSKGQNFTHLYAFLTQNRTNSACFFTCNVRWLFGQLSDPSGLTCTYMYLHVQCLPCTCTCVVYHLFHSYKMHSTKFKNQFYFVCGRKISTIQITVPIYFCLNSAIICRGLCWWTQIKREI